MTRAHRLHARTTTLYRGLRGWVRFLHGRPPLPEAVVPRGWAGALASVTLVGAAAPRATPSSSCSLGASKLDSPKRHASRPLE